MFGFVGLARDACEALRLTEKCEGGAGLNIGEIWTIRVRKSSVAWGFIVVTVDDVLNGDGTIRMRNDCLNGESELYLKPPAKPPSLGEPVNETAIVVRKSKCIVHLTDIC